MEPILAGPGARAPAALSDHLLEEILVRVGAPADLARASAACKAFRRLITDPTFLRRYRALHPPLLLGFIDSFSTFYLLPAGAPNRNASNVGFLPAEAPHRNAPAARAFAGAADFFFNHMPQRKRPGWRPCDARDGRVLLMSTYPKRGLVSRELAVCDPLTRGYTVLPPIPDGLLASVRAQVPSLDVRWEFFNALFDPSVGNEEAQFRVICWRQCSVMAAAVFVYSSVSGSWTHGAISWAALGLNVQLEGIPLMCLLSYAYGCLYCGAGINSKMIKLDINSVEFTTVSLPSDHGNRNTVFVEAGEGRIGMFSIVYENPQPLRYSIWPNESDADDRPVETIIPLPREYEFYDFDPAVAPADGYIFLVGHRDGLIPNSAFFSVEIKTMKVERVCLSRSESDYKIPYFGFPPFMSPRRI